MIVPRIEDWLKNYSVSLHYENSRVRDILVQLNPEYHARIKHELIAVLSARIEFPQDTPFIKGCMLVRYAGFQLYIVESKYNFITPVMFGLNSEEVFNPTYLDPLRKPRFPRAWDDAANQ